MAESIQSFVEKLQSEGVEAGKAEAEKIVADAKAEAERIVAEANEQAKSIIADAEAQAEKLAARQQSELDLAARDMVLKLREGVNAAVTTLIQHEVSKSLDDKEFLPKLIHEVVLEYAKEDAAHSRVVSLNVNKDMMEALTDWAIKYIGQQKMDKVRANIDLKSNLKARGFEYAVGGSTVEVTVESIVEVLKQHMTPAMRDVLDRALSKIDQ